MQTDADVLAYLARERTVNHAASKALRDECGLTISTGKALVSTTRKAQYSMGVLSRAWQVTMGAATACVDLLKHKGYVTRRRSLDDRRVVYVMMTDRGEAVKKVALRIFRDALASAEKGEET